MELFSFGEEQKEEEVLEEEKNIENAAGMPNILRALDLKDRTYFDKFGKDYAEREKVWDRESYPALRWFSTVVGEDVVDWAEARRQGRKKGDKKGPWPSTAQDSANTAYYILAVNETVNLHFWDLKKYPKLLFLLMCFVGSGQPEQHKWLKMVNNKRQRNIFEELMVRYYPDADRRELEILSKKYNNPQDLAGLALKFGMDDAEITKLIEFKFGKTNASSKKKAK